MPGNEFEVPGDSGSGVLLLLSHPRGRRTRDVTSRARYRWVGDAACDDDDDGACDGGAAAGGSEHRHFHSSWMVTDKKSWAMATWMPFELWTSRPISAGRSETTRGRAGAATPRDAPPLEGPSNGGAAPNTHCTLDQQFYPIPTLSILRVFLGIRLRFCTTC
ncbi:hypothetical protein BDQ12DRAFT_671798 [Crucibulum laeve]|uniref:Uncharacterized protein n=1 Tax=Crucibulum laeve TaxID=68775 RepID=A0A5C3LRY9_9AGAR|nr:hypothetical protein BDQ12DRAFT_671798 [Crucibulum laeve]